MSNMKILIKGNVTADKFICGNVKQMESDATESDYDIVIEGDLHINSMQVSKGQVDVTGYAGAYGIEGNTGL